MTARNLRVVTITNKRKSCFTTARNLRVLTKGRKRSDASPRRGNHGEESAGSDDSEESEVGDDSE